MYHLFVNVNDKYSNNHDGLHSVRNEIKPRQDHLPFYVLSFVHSFFFFFVFFLSVALLLFDFISTCDERFTEDTSQMRSTNTDNTSTGKIFAHKTRSKSAKKANK